MRVSIDVRHVGLPGVGRFAAELTAALLRRSDGPEIVPMRLPPARAGRAGWLGRQSLAVPHTRGEVELRSPPFAPFEALEIRRAARRSDPALHHSTHMAVPARMPVAVVLTVHDLFPLVFPDHARSRAAATYYRRVLPRAIRRATATVAVSEYTAAEMKRVLGVAPDAVIGHGVDHAAWRLGADRCGTSPDAGAVTTPPDGFVLYVGTAKRHKNLATLLRAHTGAAQLPTLVLAGPTAAEAAACGPVHPERVHALGRVADSALPALYRRAGVVVVPSLYEGVGLTALEAMSFGVPVVAADSPGLRDTVGDAAALVPATNPAAWADAVDRLLPDRGGAPLRDLIVERGRRRSGAMRWDDTAAAYAELYESLARR